ncbi:MAG: diacylglycerol kinase [Flavobacterium sp.]|nr:MAG: diacylglycerol kinase [Flavobacterium sp.]
MKNNNSFIKGRIKGIYYALKGSYLLIKQEASIKVQAVIAILITIAGFYFHISTTEWMFQVLAIGLVMGTEGINTAIEEIADFIHPEQHPKIGLIKDLSAGAVFLTALAAIVIACIIYIPKIF